MLCIVFPCLRICETGTWRVTNRIIIIITIIIIMVTVQTAGNWQCAVICSAKVMEEKLRYAAYNCIAIDTDTSPTRSYDDY